MPLWLILCSVGFFTFGVSVGATIAYLLVLHAASWGVRASAEARSGQTGLFGPQHGSPEVEMAEKRERYMQGDVMKPVVQGHPDWLGEHEREANDELPHNPDEEP